MVYRTSRLSLFPLPPSLSRSFFSLLHPLAPSLSHPFTRFPAPDDDDDATTATFPTVAHSRNFLHRATSSTAPRAQPPRLRATIHPLESRRFPCNHFLLPPLFAATLAASFSRRMPRQNFVLDNESGRSWVTDERWFIRGRILLALFFFFLGGVRRCTTKQVARCYSKEIQNCEEF